MSNRAKQFMDKIWDVRNNTADTEEKLVASILRLSLDYVTLYNTQNDMQVLSAEDLVNLSNEVETLL